MLNHCRTLLLNKGGVPTSLYPGEELVPPNFTEIAPLPSDVVSARRVLFGASPDRLMLNYRLRQFMTVLHTGPLAGAVTAFDDRIAYEIGTDDDTLFSEYLYKPSVMRLYGLDADVLSISGAPAAPDAGGKTTFSYRVSIVSGPAAKVERTNAPLGSVITPFTLTDGLSGLIELPDSGYSFRLNTVNDAALWRISVYNRPQSDLGALTASLEKLGEPALLSLFGVDPQTEPQKTLKNIWEDLRETPTRLSAFLLALMYRMEAVRTVSA